MVKQIRWHHPETIEEKIIAAADNLTKHDKEISLSEMLKRWKTEFGDEYANRVRKLHDEVVG